MKIGGEHLLDVEEEGEVLRQEGWLLNSMRSRIATFGLLYAAVLVVLAADSTPSVILILQGGEPDDWSESTQELLVGEETLVGEGRRPQVVWLNDRYGLVVTKRWPGGDGVWVTYSKTGAEWSRPSLVSEVTQEGVPPTGSMLRRSDGSCSLVYYGARRKQGEARLFLVSSDDGIRWSKPIALPMGPISGGQLLGVSLAESSDRELILAVAADGNVHVMRSIDDEWQDPQLAISTDGQPLLADADISIIEEDGELLVAHASSPNGVFVSRELNSGWNVTIISGPELFPYYGGASMIRLDDGRTIVAFDHKASIYLAESEDAVNWGEPKEVVQGVLPSITTAGTGRTMLAFKRDSESHVTLLAAP
jgi:hypothetical protein